MQFQIECNSLDLNQICLICKQQLRMRDARLIISSDRGDSYGDVCYNCIVRGSTWLNSQLQKLDNRSSVLT
ncbi:hypothetical protein BV372_07990 [Nostoc sp. T09]|nr:hypothetical protein BV372_07990 [Nostoc sp. T09]